MSKVQSEWVSTAKPSAIVSRAALTRQRSGIERWSALVVLLGSFVGTIAVCSGGWDKLAAGLWLLIQKPEAAGGVVVMILLGCLIQGVLTGLQWAYKDNPPVAHSSRAIDAGLTLWGWGPLFIGGLTTLLAGVTLPYPDIAAWIILTLVSYLAAWYPESRLVD